MDPEAVLAVLPHRIEEAKSLKEIAREMDLKISSHKDWIRTQRTLARVLRALIKGGWVARDERQNDDGQKFWHNVYWRTELESQVDRGRSNY
jgi:DNA-binding MarR family transcriptional regulator